MSRIIYTTIILFVFFICGCNTVNNEINDATFSIEEYEKLVDKYNIQDYIPTKSENIDKYEHLRPIETLEQLEAILSELEKAFVFDEKLVKEVVSIDALAVPSLKTGLEGPDVVRVYKVYDSGRTDVFVNIQSPSVVNSAFYPSGFMPPLFIGYEHVSGSASLDGSKINFAAYGDMIFKIALDGIEIKRTPVVTYGYYNKSTGVGELTN